MQENLQKLLHLTRVKKYNEIKELLNSLDIKIKGQIFERYLTAIFEGNGFVAVNKGGAYDGGADILLSYPNNPNEIVWVVQAKNFQRPLNNSEILAEVKKFEEIAEKQYNCRYYMIISLNGYNENIGIFNKLNVALEDFAYLKVLIDNYSDDKCRDIILPDLRPHNRYSYKELQAILEENNRAAVSNATGTGKSFIILQLLFAYLDKNSILLAPTKEIIEQLKSIAPWSTKSCTMYTYSKIAAMHKQNKLNDLKIDLILLDELHRTGAETWGKAVKHILSNNENAKIVGFSATPIRFLDNNRDMVEELMGGNSTTPLTLSDGIVRRILPSPIYVSAIYNLDKEINKRIMQMQDQQLTKEDEKIYLNELKEYKRLWENENSITEIINRHLSYRENIKFIVFCENNVHLTKMKEIVEGWFKGAFPLCSKVTSYIITAENRAVKKDINSFQNINEPGEIKLIFSISKLNEGVHIKDISGIMMLRNTKSPVIYYQQLGRCLTCDNLEQEPIIFDFVDNIDNLELINFRRNLLESNKENNKYRESLGLCERNINIALYEEHEDIINKFRKIERKITYNWYDNFNHLVKFYELHNHLNVPNEGTYLRLYKWCSMQRSLYNKEVLGKEFIECLEAIDFKWDLRLEKWKEKYQKYHKILENSTTAVISYYEIIDDKKYIIIYEFKNLSQEEEKIVSWFNRQVNDFKNSTMEKGKAEIFKGELNDIDKYQDNLWMKSIWKIKEFYQDINEQHKINIYKYKIAPDNEVLKRAFYGQYHNSRIVINTIDKNLPKSRSRSIINNKEIESRMFIREFLKNNISKDKMSKYIDNINYVYYNEIINLAE